MCGGALTAKNVKGVQKQRAAQKEKAAQRRRSGCCFQEQLNEDMVRPAGRAGGAVTDEFLKNLERSGWEDEGDVMGELPWLDRISGEWKSPCSQPDSRPHMRPHSRTGKAARLRPCGTD